MFGIGTQSNNRPATSVFLPSDSNGNFTTTFGGAAYAQSFIDSGSNALFFPASSEIPECPSGAASGLYCPSSMVGLSATQQGYNAGAMVPVAFDIIPALAALTGSNRVFNNLGGAGSGGFDWGLPFLGTKRLCDHER